MTSSFRLWSAAFDPGGRIPKRYTCDEANLSPPISWSEPPAGTRALALVVDDPDAPRRTFTHWIAYNIPPDYNGRVLSEGQRPGVDQGALEGTNDFGMEGYGGPCPPRGSVHTYVFRAYALDEPLTLAAGATREQLFDAMQDHVLAEATFEARYGR